jgi:HK97 family phage portal protein
MANRWPALFARAKTGAHKHVSHSVTPQAYMFPAGQPVWMQRDYTRFAEEGFRRNVIAYRAISMIASAAASVPFLLEQKRRTQVTVIESHPLLSLLARPNPRQGGAELFEALYSYRLISGNAYLHAIGPRNEAPLELHSLRPDRIAIIPGQGGIPKAYRYKVGERSMEIAVDSLSGQSRLLHLKHFHPLDDWYGMSPIEAAAYSIDQHNECSAWNQALLQNGARPSGALLVKPEHGNAGTLSEQQYSRLKQQIDEQFSGAVNAGRPLLLEGGLEWKEMSLSPRDMDFVGIKNASARDIALALGVPPQILGIPGDNTYSNLQEARIALWEQTIIPALHYMVAELNNWLVPMFDSSLRLRINLKSVSALSGKYDAEWQRVSSAGFLSDAEKRRMLGIAETEAGHA